MLCEPLLERAVEAQAIGRVHRVSQTRPTVVHRFVIKGTVEEAILGLRHQPPQGPSRDDDAAGASGGDARGGENGGEHGAHCLPCGNGHAAGVGSPSSKRGAGTGAVASSPNRASPNKRARRVEESKMLSWETVVALGLANGPALSAPPPVAGPSGDDAAGGGSE